MHDLIERVLATKPVCPRISLRHTLAYYSIRLTSKAVTKFCRLADDSDAVPALTGGKSYADYTLQRAEWELLELMCEVLKVCVFDTYDYGILISTSSF